jgi:hypothetical protein
VLNAVENNNTEILTVLTANENTDFNVQDAVSFELLKY